MSNRFHGVKIEYDEDTFDGQHQWQVTIPPRAGDDASLAPFGIFYFDDADAALDHVTTVVGSRAVRTMRHGFAITEQASGRFRVESASLGEEDIGFWGWLGTYDHAAEAITACANELTLQWVEDEEEN